MEPILKRKTFTLPIKGSYYYSAELADDIGLLQLGSPLQLIAEPDNAQDKNAIQLWLVHFPSLLLGYVPRRKARFIGFLLKHQLIQQPITLHKINYQDDRLKLQFQLHYSLSWQLRLIYWLGFLRP
ncbi:HIRAN domain-containing protein [Hydrogenovibrio kuenenii]|uniref:HIRAN domain-containing protein n=1 Tax=Hydrogenovibrio kuenenii TaxID=63658 RepID=UPI00046778B5|nr:HIRAN domain-containing protein [Hydrogenovibrio kuenenii]